MKIGKPMDELPAARIRRQRPKPAIGQRRGKYHEVYAAVVAAKGRWIPVQMKNAYEAMRLQQAATLAGRKAAVNMKTRRLGSRTVAICIVPEKPELKLVDSLAA